MSAALPWIIGILVGIVAAFLMTYLAFREPAFPTPSWWNCLAKDCQRAIDFSHERNLDQETVSALKNARESSFHIVVFILRIYTRH